MSTVLTHWAVPIAAAALPWSAGFRLLARASRSERFVVPGEDAAWQRARQYGYAWLPEARAATTEIAWRRAYRLIQLVDRTDLYIYLSRGARWPDRHVRTSGTWPAGGPFITLTHHWGGGFWALSELARAGHRPRALTKRLKPEEFGGDIALLRYAYLRNRGIERAMGTSMLRTGGAMPEIRAMLERDAVLLALCDVPGWSSEKVRSRATIQARMKAGSITFPITIIRIACQLKIPIVLFAGGTDRQSGERWIRIEPAEVFDSPPAMAARLAAWLEQLLERDPAAWHMWPFADELLLRAPVGVAAATDRTVPASAEVLGAAPDHFGL